MKLVIWKVNYKKDSYSISAGSICAILIAGVFIFWGINSFFGGHFSFGLSWMGFIWLGIGSVILFSQIGSIYNKGKLRKIVLQEFELKPDVSLEEISRSTGISLKDVKAIVLDLKMRGVLKGPFNTETGRLEAVPLATTTPPAPPSPRIAPVPPRAPLNPTISAQKYEVNSEEEDVRVKPKFCPNCGTAINRFSIRSN